MRIGIGIKYARKYRKLSQTELSKKADLTQVTISLIESGKTKHPSKKTLLKISNALGVTLPVLMSLSLEEKDSFDTDAFNRNINTVRLALMLLI